MALLNEEEDDYSHEDKRSNKDAEGRETLEPEKLVSL